MRDSTRAAQIRARARAGVVFRRPGDGDGRQGYIMRAESPAAAQHWVEVLNRIRTLKKDTEEDRDSVSEQRQYPAHAHVLAPCHRAVARKNYMSIPRAERETKERRKREERETVRFAVCRTAVSPCGHMIAFKPLMALAPSLHPRAASSTNTTRFVLLALDYAAAPLTFAHARDGPNQPVRKPEENFCFCFNREKQNFDASSDGTSTLPL